MGFKFWRLPETTRGISATSLTRSPPASSDKSLLNLRKEDLMKIEQKSVKNLWRIILSDKNILGSALVQCIKLILW